LIRPPGLPDGAWQALVQAEQSLEQDAGLQAYAKVHRERIECSIGLLASDPLTQPCWFDGDGHNGLIDLVLLVQSLPRLQEALARRSIPADVLNQTLPDVGLWMTKFHRQHGVWGTAEQPWLVNHFTGRLFRLGRLQFEPVRWLEALGWPKALGGVKAGDPVFSVHITEGERLDPEACRESYALATEFFPRYFPEVDFVAFACHSWLLDAALTRVLPPESNIVRFQAGYLTQPAGDDSQLRERVFGDRLADPLTSPAHTSLQKRLQEAYRRGVEFHESVGVRAL